MSEHDLIDATVSNQIALRRYLAREIRRMLELFAEHDQQLADLLRRKYRQSMTLGSPQLKALYKEVQELRDDLMKKAGERSRSMAEELAPVEEDREWALLVALLALSGRRPARTNVSEVLSAPFDVGASSAATYSLWMKRLRMADQNRIRDALLLSVNHSEATEVMLNRVVGSEAKLFADGMVSRTRANIAALLQTLGNHISSFVRLALWQRTGKVVGGVWTSVLDSRTSAICRSRDNKVVMFPGHRAPAGAVLLDPQSARPPAHANCRSTLSPLREGPLPQRRTYEGWLKDQPDAVQNQILGKAKAEMFRRGAVSLEGFVDSSGKELTIQQLLEA